jgi:hypothetical protein
LLDVVAGEVELLDVVVAGLLLDDWDEDELEPPPHPASASASATSAAAMSRLWVELFRVMRSPSCKCRYAQRKPSELSLG